MTSPSIFYMAVRPRSLKIRCLCSFDIVTGVELINSFNNPALVVLYIFKVHYILFSYRKQLCEASLNVPVIPDRSGAARLGGKIQATL